MFSCQLMSPMTIGDSRRFWVCSRLDLGLLTTKSACCLHKTKRVNVRQDQIVKSSGAHNRIRNNNLRFVLWISDAVFMARSKSSAR